MVTFGEVAISTTDKELWDKLFDLQVEGVEAKLLLHKGFKGDGLVFKAVVHFVVPAAVGYFANWLYDHHGRHGEGETTIEGQRIPQKCLEITNVIMEQITINNSYRIERPESERIPEE